MNDTGLVIPYAVKAGAGRVCTQPDGDHDRSSGRVCASPRYSPTCRWSMTNRNPQVFGRSAISAPAAPMHAPSKLCPMGHHPQIRPMCRPSKACENGPRTLRNVSVSGQNSHRTVRSVCGSVPSTAITARPATVGGSGWLCPLCASLRCASRAIMASGSNPAIGGRMHIHSPMLPPVSPLCSKTHRASVPLYVFPSLPAH